jgi:Na+/melibiose symporter-like transporter
VFIGSSLLSGSFFILLFLPGAQSLGWINTLNILGKMAYAPAVPLLWTMIADAADYAEWTSGRRATGLFFSAATFAQKGGWGIGGALAGWMLAAFGYVELATEQTALALTGIKLLISSLVSLIAIALFIAEGAIAWREGMVVLLGTVAGGYIAAHVSRQIPQAFVRGFVILAGSFITFWFFVATYR